MVKQQKNGCWDLEKVSSITTVRVFIERDPKILYSTALSCQSKSDGLFYEAHNVSYRLKGA